MLYQWDLTRRPVKDVIDSMEGLQKSGESARSFAKDLVEGTVERVEEIDALLAHHSERWRLDRMSVVDRNLLRLAVYELLSKASPASVVINEALEVAKRFSTPESPAFVNGVLDAVSVSLGTTAERA
jgi:N utilization substance protein B